MNAGDLGFDDDESQPDISQDVSATSYTPLYVPTPLARCQAKDISPPLGNANQKCSQLTLLETVEKLQKYHELDDGEERNEAKLRPCFSSGPHPASAGSRETRNWNHENASEDIVGEDPSSLLKITVQSAVSGTDIVVVNIDAGQTCRKLIDEVSKIVDMTWKDLSLLYNGELLCPEKTIEGNGITTEGVVLAIFSPRRMYIEPHRCCAKIIDESSGDVKVNFDVGLALVTCAAWSPDFRSVLIAADFQATLRDCVTRACVRTYRHDSWVQSACYSSDGLHVLTASSDGTAVLWETRTGHRETVFSEVGEAITLTHAEFSDDSMKIITFGKSGDNGFRHEWERSGAQLRADHLSSAEVDQLRKAFLESVSRISKV